MGPPTVSDGTGGRGGHTTKCPAFQESRMVVLQSVDVVSNLVADPVSLVLVYLGATFLSAAMLVLGGLAAGAALQFFMPTRPARTHGR